MIRIISLLVGAFFSLALLIAFGTGLVNYVSEPPAPTAEKLFVKHPKEVHFASDGVFGHFDEQQLQRGFAVHLGADRDATERRIQFAGNMEHGVAQLLGGEATGQEGGVISD